MSYVTMSNPVSYDMYEVRVVGLKNSTPLLTNNKEMALTYSGLMRDRGYMTKFSLLRVEAPRQPKMTYTLGCTDVLSRGLTKLKQAEQTMRERLKGNVEVRVDIRLRELWWKPRYKSSLLAA